MYQGSEAVRLDASGQGALSRPTTAPSFEVIEGAGLDAEARRGVSPKILARAKAIVVAIVCVAVLSAARVSILSAAVGVLAENTSMRTELKQARSTQSDLRIERSVLSSNTRIERIATQSYGMVAADGTEQMSAGATEASGDDASASADDAADTSADDAADTQDAAADGAADEASDSAASDAASSGSGSSALDNVTLTEGNGSTAGSNAADIDSLL